MQGPLVAQVQLDWFCHVLEPPGSTAVTHATSSCCLRHMSFRQVIFLSATAEPALIKACKLVAAAAAGAAAAGDGDSTGEPTVQLQRPSLFTYNKASSCAASLHKHVYCERLC